MIPKITLENAEKALDIYLNDALLSFVNENPQLYDYVVSSLTKIPSDRESASIYAKSLSVRIFKILQEASEQNNLKHIQVTQPLLDKWNKPLDLDETLTQDDMVDDYINYFLERQNAALEHRARALIVEVYTLLQTGYKNTN